MKKVLAWILALSLLLCGAAFAEDTEEIHVKVGVVGENNEQWEQVIIPTLAEEGIIIELVKFSDYIIPNQALAQGEIDMNAFQHYDFMNNWNEENSAAYGVTLVGLCDTLIAPLCIYSDKITSLDELKEGAVVAVPNDTTNEARALLLLQQEGLIKLREGAGLQATILDIEENPLNLEIRELAAEQVARAVIDVDIACVNGNYALEADLDEAIAHEADTSEAAETYANVIVVREGNEDSEKTKALVDAVLSEEVKTFINETYNGAVLPVF